MQPVILVRGASEALALLRNPVPERPRRVIGTATHDAGRHWTRPVRLPLLNPDAGLAGVVLADGRILVALNDGDRERDALSLVLSGDGGGTWKAVHQLENQLAERLVEPGLDPGGSARTTTASATSPPPCGHPWRPARPRPNELLVLTT